MFHYSKREKEEEEKKWNETENREKNISFKSFKIILKKKEV